MSKLASEPPSSEITPESLYLGRREFLKNAALTAGTAVAVGSGLLWLVGAAPPPDAPVEQPVDQPLAQPVAVASAPSPYNTDEPQTSYQGVTTYNNYYEFGVDKDEPARNAHTLQTRPWTISVEGEVAKPQ